MRDRAKHAAYTALCEKFNTKTPDPQKTKSYAGLIQDICEIAAYSRCEELAKQMGTQYQKGFDSNKLIKSVSLFISKLKDPTKAIDKLFLYIEGGLPKLIRWIISGKTINSYTPIFKKKPKTP